MSKILIFAPHPDDEVIGCGGLILKQSKSVKVVYLTTGISRLGFRRLGSHGKVFREGEALAAMKLAGLKKSDLFFLPHDSYFALNKEEFVKAEHSIADLIKEFNPAQIYMPAFEGGHFDHDVANFLMNKVVDSLNKPMLTYEYPTYNNYPIFFFDKIKKFFSAHPPRPRFIPLNGHVPFILDMSEEELTNKKAMLQCYKSQNKDNLLVRLYGYKDMFRTCPRYDYSKRPHGFFPLNYEITTRLRFKDFLKTVK